MRLSIKAEGVSVPDQITEQARHHVNFALARFGDRVRSVVIQFTEADLPRGGAAIECRLTVGIGRSGQVVVEENNHDVVAAVARAADRAARAVERQLKPSAGRAFSVQSLHPAGSGER